MVVILYTCYNIREYLLIIFPKRRENKLCHSPMLKHVYKMYHVIILP